jgi:hypothetical protein
MYSIDLRYIREGDGYIGEWVLYHWDGGHSHYCAQMTQLEAEQLRQQAAQQLEAQLFVGFKLDLQQLLQPALRFLRASSMFLLPDLATNPGPIFSQRVLAAAGGASGVDLLSRSCMRQPLGSGFGINRVLSDVEYDTADEGSKTSAVSFMGTLKQDLYAFSKGTRVHATFWSDGDLVLRDVNADQGEDSQEGNDNEPVDTTYEFGVVLGPLQTLSVPDWQC